MHNDSCPQCSQLQTLLSTPERKCSSEQLSEDDRAEMLHVFRQAKEDILSWKAHQLCSVHQAEAKHSVLERSRPPISIIGSRLGYEIYAAEISRGTVRLVCKAWFAMAYHCSHKKVLGVWKF